MQLHNFSVIHLGLLDRPLKSFVMIQYYQLFKEGLVTHCQYASYRNKITSLLRKHKANYYNQIFSKNMGNIKKCWKLINNICKENHHKTIDKINFEGELIENPNEIVKIKGCN